MLQGIVKQEEPYKFYYKARYYNRENGDIRREKTVNGGDTEVNFSEPFCRKMKENRDNRNNSIKKMILMFAVLALLLYLIIR